VEPLEESFVRTTLLDRFRTELATRARLQVTPTSGRDAGELTIVVCTRDRTDLLKGCLEHLLALDPPPGDLLVVDNAPTGPATAALAAQLGVRRVLEPRPGLDRARNLGWREATTPLVAYVDDDARVHRRFARAVSGAFFAPEVAGTTGLVVPAELATTSQIKFEAIGGMGKGYRRRVFHRTAAPVDVQPFRVGVGTNMAFRRDVLEALSGFDPRLDVGTGTRGGGDLDMFHRVLEWGGVIVYEPSAVVRHIHRRDWKGLVGQHRDNGVAYHAFLTKAAEASPEAAAMVESERRRWLTHHIGRGLARAVRRRDTRRLRLIGAELLGSSRGSAALAAETTAGDGDGASV
jgi:GT2 family glycosyltransferase